MLTFSEIFLLFPVIVTALWFVSFTFSKTSLRNPRFIMALFMGCAFLTFLSGIGIYAGLIHLYTVIYPLIFFTALALFPLFYIYVLEITKPTSIHKRLLWHFLPATILFILSITLYGIMMNEEEKHFYINKFLLARNPESTGIHWKFILMNKIDKLAKISYIGLSIFYYIMTFLLVQKHQQSIEDYYASLKEVSLNWVKTLGIFFVLALLSGITVHWFHRLDILNNELLSSMPFLFLGLFFAVVGNHSNKQNVHIFPSENTSLNEEESIAVSKEIINQAQNENTLNDSSLPEGLKAKLEDYFSEYRPYLNPELKIWDIARDLNTNRTYISRLINQEYGMRFSAFVNQHRITEAKKLMTAPKSRHFSLTVIASMSGFLNYSSFVRSFKYFEATTPKEFKLVSEQSNTDDTLLTNKYFTTNEPDIKQ